MRSIFFPILLIILLSSGCSTSAIENIGKEAADQISNITDADNKYVLMVKNGYRSDKPDLTYNTAFENYFGTPTWKYFKSDDGDNIVEFTGDCISAVGRCCRYLNPSFTI